MEKRKFLKRSKGITLIALVISIIVIIILSGVSINLTLGDNAIFAKAKETKKLQKIAELTEELELYKPDMVVDTLGISSLQIYMQKILDENVIEEKDIQETGEENSRYITLEEEYIFLIEEEENTNIRIEYLGTVKEMSPKIVKITPEISGYSIKVTVETVYNIDGDYQYFIKESTAERYEEKEKTKSNECTFEGLKPNVEYNIKVRVTNNKNLSSEKEIEVTTGEGNVIYYIDTDNIKTQEFSYGESVLNPSFTPSKDKYIFIGWKEDTVANGEVLTSKLMGTKEITLYAVYKRDISLKYNGNGATSGSMQAQSVTQYYNAAKNEEKASFTLRGNSFEKVGYTFEGWSTTAGGAKVYSNGQTVSDLVIESGETLNLYAVWKTITYKITYNLSIGTIPSGYTKEFTVETETFNLPTPTGTNYVFKGWYGNSSFSGTQITQIAKGTVGNKVIYAKEHQHTGTSGQSSANGCYTKAQAYGGSCGGHYWESVQWYCGRCGKPISGQGAGDCGNRVCAADGVGDWARTTGSGYNYCSSSSGCNNWRWQYRYILGCGWQ